MSLGKTRVESERWVLGGLGCTGIAALTTAAAFAVVAALCACTAAPAAPSVVAPQADVAFPLAGVPDLGDDPAVVVIDTGAPSSCAGALVAPDVVLTSESCVGIDGATNPCSVVPAGALDAPMTAPPQSVRVLVGAGPAPPEERARGIAVVTAADAMPPCAASVAAVVLDTPIDGIRPLTVLTRGAALGSHARTVAYARLPGAAYPTRVVRDHVRVVGTTGGELTLAEACLGAGGGPALDEATGEIEGIALESPRLPCGGATDGGAYAQLDESSAVLAEALARVAPARASKGDLAALKGPIDVGADCAHGSDCAAGVCVTDRDRRYCSRVCGPGDRCPARYVCTPESSAMSVCLAR